MKDLDFDELDRAVNSLIGGTNSTTTTTPPQTDVVAAPVTPQVSTVAPVASEPTELPDSPRPLAARRSSGRFMDVVHPSSDMRTTLTAPRPTISREASLVSPSTDQYTSAVPDIENIQNAQPVDESPVEAAWPDPLTFNAYKPEQYTQSPVVELATADENNTDQDIDNLADAINQSLGQDAPQEPQESPFLSDAKVEKRPLGAFSVEPAVEQPVETPVLLDLASELQSEPEPVESVETAHPVVASAPLPAELQSDLLSIESDQDTTGQPVSNQPLEPAVISSPVQPMAALSIPQQYTEKSSTGDQPVGAIFDSEAYRKPLAHPNQKKSGWLMVLWILLLLIVGAGAGAAVYFYVLPML